jgi:hypothetical protein
VPLQLDEAAQTIKETARSEAAALLERRMAAMEAVLAARRAALEKPPEPEAARGPGADLRFSVTTQSRSVPASIRTGKCSCACTPCCALSQHTDS